MQTRFLKFLFLLFLPISFASCAPSPSPTKYTVTVTSEDISKGTVTGGGSYTYGTQVTVTATPKTDYSFDGWYNTSGGLVSSSASYEFTMPSHDTTLTARFASIPVKYTLTVTSEDTSKGTVTGGGSYAYGTQVTVTATPKTGYLFDGWYNGLAKVSTSASYSFTMGASNISLVAKFFNKKEKEEWDKKHGVIPVVDNNYVTYGLYPQTHVNDASLISELDKLTNPDEHGYYFYENEYYTKVSAKPYESNYTFDDGTTIVSGTKYWFKLEAIKWKILTNTDGQYFLTSDKLLDAQRYGESYNGTKFKTDYKGETANVYANNYKYSDLRTYLNTTFYNMAFFLADTDIKTTTVDNSVSSTGSSMNPYACENTQDKVFALSYTEVTNVSYGFTNNAARKCLTTDYARAVGAYQNSKYGDYYLRSPNCISSSYAGGVDYDGLIYFNRVNNGDYGLRPVLWLDIKS